MVGVFQFSGSPQTPSGVNGGKDAFFQSYAGQFALHAAGFSKALWFLNQQILLPLKAFDVGKIVICLCIGFHSGATLKDQLIK